MKEWLEMFKHLYQLQKQVHSELRIDHKTQVRTILERSPTFPTADADSLVDRLSNIAMVFIFC